MGVSFSTPPYSLVLILALLSYPSYGFSAVKWPAMLIALSVFLSGSDPLLISISAFFLLLVKEHRLEDQEVSRILLVSMMVGLFSGPVFSKLSTLAPSQVISKYWQYAPLVLMFFWLVGNVSVGSGEKHRQLFFIFSSSVVFLTAIILPISYQSQTALTSFFVGSLWSFGGYVGGWADSKRYAMAFIFAGLIYAALGKWSIAGLDI